MLCRHSHTTTLKRKKVSQVEAIHSMWNLKSIQSLPSLRCVGQPTSGKLFKTIFRFSNRYKKEGKLLSVIISCII